MIVTATDTVAMKINVEAAREVSPTYAEFVRGVWGIVVVIFAMYFSGVSDSMTSSGVTEKAIAPPKQLAVPCLEESSNAQ